MAPVTVPVPAPPPSVTTAPAADAASLRGLTPYERRLRLAAGAVSAHTDLSPELARDLAAHVLDAVDRIPERIR
ncbi:MAG: DUF6307 family protein [Kineosporiaceae bacterium]